MRLTLILTALTLAACGVDGEPSAPEPVAKSSPGVSITGRAEVGVAKRW